jgi:hypothetical protein
MSILASNKKPDIMKKLIYIVILTLGFVSCTSNDEAVIDNSELLGKWTWISSCGGFTGGCWYPSVENYSSIEFTKNLYIEKNNGVITAGINYAITDTYLNGTDLIYTLKLEDGLQIRLRFVNENLSIEGGDFWKEYERNNE